MEAALSEKWTDSMFTVAIAQAANIIIYEEGKFARPDLLAILRISQVHMPDTAIAATRPVTADYPRGNIASIRCGPGSRIASPN